MPAPGAEVCNCRGRPGWTLGRCGRCLLLRGRTPPRGAGGERPRQRQRALVTFCGEAVGEGSGAARDSPPTDTLALLSDSKECPMQTFQERTMQRFLRYGQRPGLSAA